MDHLNLTGFIFFFQEVFCFTQGSLLEADLPIFVFYNQIIRDGCFTLLPCFFLLKFQFRKENVREKGVEAE